MRPIIYPWKMASKSARELSRALRDVRAKRVWENGNYRPYRNHLIINWGNPRIPTWTKNGQYYNRIYVEGAWLNRPSQVQTAQNKLRTYQVLQGVCNIPEFTINRDIVGQWFSAGPDSRNVSVLFRRTLNGHGGLGIELINYNRWLNGPAIPDAPLYVKYKKKLHEYRIHVFRDQIISIQQKRIRRGFTNPDTRIRNYERGWVFCRNDIVEPDNQVLEQARLAVRGLGLDFGAVDIGWNHHYKEATVYEVNTAPGLEGTTLTNYVNAIRRLI